MSYLEWTCFFSWRPSTFVWYGQLTATFKFSSVVSYGYASSSSTSNTLLISNLAKLFFPAYGTLLIIEEVRRAVLRRGCLPTTTLGSPLVKFPYLSHVLSEWLRLNGAQQTPTYAWFGTACQRALLTLNSSVQTLLNYQGPHFPILSRSSEFPTRLHLGLDKIHSVQLHLSAYPRLFDLPR